MATEKQQLETNDPWKARYYEVLEELEDRQRQWQETAELLNGLASQLQPAEDEKARRIPSSLRELQRNIENGNDVADLHAQINTISQALVELNRQTDSDSRLHPASVYVEILEKLKLPEQLETEFRVLKKNVTRLKWNDAGEEVSALFMNIIQRLLSEDVESTWPARKEKLISRLLARASQPAESGDDSETPAQKPASETRQRYIAPAVGELLLQLALRMPDQVKRQINFAILKKHTNKARRRKDLLPIIDVIAQQVELAYQQEQPVPVLLKIDSVEALADAIKPFFKQLDPPVDLKPRVSELEEMLQAKHDDVDTLVYCLNALNELTGEVCKRFASQRDELDKFLSRAVEQYQALEQDIQSVTSTREQPWHDNTPRINALSDEIGSIKASIETAENLQDNRAELLQRLDALAQQVNELNTPSKNDESTGEEVLARLNDRLNQMEGDSVDLRNKLDAFRLQTLQDVLTGIGNRQAFERQLAVEVARCKRYGSTFSLVVWNVDQFTDTIESYGHAAGDRVLQTVADSLSQNVRGTDFVARYAKDIFVLLLTETSLEGARSVAAKLASQVGETPFVYRDIPVAITVSGGITQFKQTDTAASLFERADAAMRKARSADIASIVTAD